MRKLIFTLTLIIFISFSFGCNLIDLGKTVSFSPPDWIIGTWSDEYDTNVYTFTNDNIVLSVSGVVSVNFRDAYKNKKVDDFQETKTSTLYEFTISDEDGSGAYKFQKTSDTTLNYWITADGVAVGPLELIKE